MQGSRSKFHIVSDPKRRNIILSGFFGCTALITARLWYLQIIRGNDFSIAAIKNRIREIARPAPRGLVYDKNGKTLLSNRLFFDLIIIPQYLQNRDKTISILSDLFHIPKEVIERKLLESQSNPKFVPVRIKRNLSLHEVATLESNKFFLPGVDVDSAPRRDYLGNESAHLYGYLGEVTLKELDILNASSPNYSYRVGSIIGKTGIEKKYEEFLRGGEGKEALLVDALGRLQLDADYNFALNLSKPAERGNDVHLTIDSDLQNTAIEAFRNKNGAVCAMDPNSGAILAYVSSPNYKLSMYQDGLNGSDWQSLRSNPFKPLLDKVTGGAYPPGSTFKVVTAIAALEEGVVNIDHTFNCPGYYSLGRGRWKCWQHRGHGVVNMPLAIQKSCDVYFYNVGNLLGIDRIAKWAKILGLGEKTGLDLNMELSGIVPSSEWKLRTKGLPWQSGDTINCSIGQGFNLYTPLQILSMYSSIANGGKLFKPYLMKKVVDKDGKTLLEEKPTLVRELNIKPGNLAAIHKGLFDVVNGATPTARKAKVPGFFVSGKTGTAQNSALKFTKGKSREDVSFQALDHAWFVCFSSALDPLKEGANKPEIALIVFSEFDGGGGGANAAPIASTILKSYWRKKYPERFKQDSSLTSSSMSVKVHSGEDLHSSSSGMHIPLPDDEISSEDQMLPNPISTLEN